MKTVKVKSLGDCPYLISMEEDDVIGQGSYGTVVKAFNKNNPYERLVAKVFSLADLNKKQSALQQLIIVSRFPSHPNLVQYKKVKISSNNCIYIIMEQCSKGSLKNMIEKKNFIFEEIKVWEMIYSLVEGYKILYKNKVIHRDIKPENILIDDCNGYKIGDFGLSELMYQLNQSTKIKGSLYYMAPQLFNNGFQSISPLNDIYSFGVLIYFVCFKKYPYLQSTYSTIKEFKKKLNSKKIQFPVSNYSNELIQLISSMLEKDPHQRCNWQYIFSLLLSKKVNKINQCYPNQQQNLLEFHIVEISDAFLKNLSFRDLDLRRLLKRQSIVIVDNVQTQILIKRDFVYYCDRIYTQLSNLSKKFNLTKLQLIIKLLAISNYLHSKALYNEFQFYYSKIEKCDLMEIVGSYKYLGLKKLIQQDYHALNDLIKQEDLQQMTSKYTISTINGEVYQNCSNIIIELLKLNQIRLSCQIDHLQQFYELKNTSILFKSRKNQNALIDFFLRLSKSKNQQLQQMLSFRYRSNCKI